MVGSRYDMADSVYGILELTPEIFQPDNDLGSHILFPWYKYIRTPLEASFHIPSTPPNNPTLDYPSPVDKNPK